MDRLRKSTNPMKPHSILIVLVIFLTSSCDRTPTAAEGRDLYLHWFTIGSEQEFIPIQSSEVRLGEDIDSGCLKGKVLRDSKGLHATLRGKYGLSVGDFRNYIEAGEPFGPTVYSYSGVIHTTYFVVTSNPDPKSPYNQLMKRRTAQPTDDGSFEINLNVPLFAGPEPGF